MSRATEHIFSLVKARIEYAKLLTVEADELQFTPMQLSPQLESGITARAGRAWSLAEMLESYDLKFLENAYEVVLNRDADATGVSSRREAMARGAMSRVEVLFRLRHSPEGRRHKAVIKGLTTAFIVERLCALPVLGIVPRILRALVYLPRLQADIEKIKASVAMHADETEGKLESIVEFQNAEFDKVAQFANKKKNQ